jgi:hypothetical protein
MNPLAIALVALALVPIGACVLAQTAARATAPNAKQSPFYCAQGALTPQERKRHFDSHNHYRSRPYWPA